MGRQQEPGKEPRRRSTFVLETYDPEDRGLRRGLRVSELLLLRERILLPGDSAMMRDRGRIFRRKYAADRCQLRDGVFNVR